MIFTEGTQKDTVTMPPNEVARRIVMRIKLDKRWTDKLLTWPESGMGY